MLQLVESKNLCVPRQICRPRSQNIVPIVHPIVRQRGYFFGRSIGSNIQGSGIRNRLKRGNICLAAEADNGTNVEPIKTGAKREGPSTDMSVVFDRLWKLILPYWMESENKNEARIKLAGVVMLTVGTTGVSVLFNFLGRDFFNAIAQKDAETFTIMLYKWMGALVFGIPVFVFRDYYQSRLALEWREWMTEHFTNLYLQNRTFYQVQAGSLLDNPDQRISSDVRQFTDTALALSLTILNAIIDMVSFSEILYTIYPPLFVALIVYSVGGTGISLLLGKKLVGLNFQQEAQEANFRYGLVRVRENAESIAFYSGEASEARLLFQRLKKAILNYGDLLIASRNLNFFTSFYRYLIQILPAAVVAPLYFQGKIDFGVINQSSSAFNHILTDVSLIVYQLESLAGFSAVVDRLGEMQEVLEDPPAKRMLSLEGAAPGVSFIQLIDDPSHGHGNHLLELDGVTLCTPDGKTTLVKDLNLIVTEGESLLLAGPSGAGKTSILRAVAGLWSSGSGTIRRFGTPVGMGVQGDIFFVPQRPYVVLGTLRDQLLYPTWANPSEEEPSDELSARRLNAGVGSSNGEAGHEARADNGGGEQSGIVGGSGAVMTPPADADLAEALRKVRLGVLLERTFAAGGSGNRSGNGSNGAVETPTNGLDCVADWASVLSLGEQQRLAFARVLLAQPRLVLMDESTSALDTANEALLYDALSTAGISYVSVGHRPTLVNFHSRVLRLNPDEGKSWIVMSTKEEGEFVSI